MSNYKEPYGEHVEMFENKLEEANLKGVVKIKCIANDKLKKVIGDVKKAQKIVKYLNDYDVIIEFNEEVFEQLSDEHKDIVADDLIAKIHYDFDKDKINIINPDVSTFTGILNKYGTEEYLRVNEMIKEIRNQLADAKAEEETEAA